MTARDRLLAAAARGRESGVADGSTSPAGSSRNPYDRDAARLEWWVWARWYVRCRTLAGSALVQGAPLNG